MPMITGPGAFDPLLGKMRTKDVSGGTASGDYTFNTAEFTVGVAGLISLNQVPASKLDTVSDIVNVTGASVTLQPNTAYKMYATTGALNVTANPPAANKWAYEGHAEIFVGSVGYVVFDTTKIVLANQLEPDSVNNCTLRFHDGMCYVSVEDHIAGYIVVNGSTSGDGSLYYGITTSTNDYVAFDASLNGTVIPLAGAVAEGEKHIVGNGYTETTLSGNIDCSTAKVTVANLALSDVGITGGTLTLGDAYIPSGSTVAVSGGGLAVEKVTGNGGVIDLGGTNVNVPSGGLYASGCTFTGGSANWAGGAVYNGTANRTATFSNCVLSANNAVARGGGYAGEAANTGNLISCNVTGNKAVYGGGIYGAGGAVINISGTTISGNTATNVGGGFYLQDSATLNIRDSYLGTNNAGNKIYNNAKVTFAGSNFLAQDIQGNNAGTVTISSGAIVDLTGNANTVPIAPGGGITFASGGATVKVGDSTASSSYMMDNVALPAGAKLTNTNAINLGGTHIELSSGSTARVSGAVFTSGGDSISSGGAFLLNSNCSLALSNCTVSGNVASKGGAVDATRGGLTTRIDVYGGIISGNTAAATSRGFDIFTQGELSIFGATVGKITCVNGARVNISGTVANDYINVAAAGYSATVTISSGASINLTSSIAPGGGIVVETGGCTVNGVAVAGGTYTSIVSSGGSAVINQ